jgi:hypothetical protein
MAAFARLAAALARLAASLARLAAAAAARAAPAPLAAALRPLRAGRGRHGALALLLRDVVASYHRSADSDAAWAPLEAALEAAAPGGGWRSTGGAPLPTSPPRAHLFYDDQFNTPHELCRSSIGLVVGAGSDAEAEVAAAR